MDPNEDGAYVIILSSDDGEAPVARCDFCKGNLEVAFYTDGNTGQEYITYLSLTRSIESHECQQDETKAPQEPTGDVLHKGSFT